MSPRLVSVNVVGQLRHVRHVDEALSVRVDGGAGDAHVRAAPHELLVLARAEAGEHVGERLAVRIGVVDAEPVVVLAAREPDEGRVELLDHLAYFLFTGLNPYKDDTLRKKAKG